MDMYHHTWHTCTHVQTALGAYCLNPYKTKRIQQCSSTVRMLTKVVFVLVVVLALIAFANAKCIDEFEAGHCKVFAPFCGDTKYSAIASKCKSTCGMC